MAVVSSLLAEAEGDRMEILTMGRLVCICGCHEREHSSGCPTSLALYKMLVIIQLCCGLKRV